MNLSIRIRGLLWLVFGVIGFVFCMPFVLVMAFGEWVRYGNDDEQLYLHSDAFIGKPLRMLFLGRE